MEETGFSYGCYLKFQRESTYIIEEHTKVMDNIWWINGTVWAKVEDSMVDVSGGSQKALNQISSVLEALSFRRIDAHHACISEKQASKRDLALTMSLAESLMYR